MDFDERTTSLLKELERLTGKPLARREEVGMLIEIAHRNKLDQTLDELAFYAKFCHKSYGIMQRIGKQGEGYAKLSEEFNANATRCRHLVETLASYAPEEIRRRFMEEFLAMTPTAFANLLSLFHDVSWLKNLQIEQRQKPD